MFTFHNDVGNENNNRCYYITDWNGSYFYRLEIRESRGPFESVTLFIIN